MATRILRFIRSVRGQNHIHRSGFRHGSRAHRYECCGVYKQQDGVMSYRRGHRQERIPGHGSHGADFWRVKYLYECKCAPSQSGESAIALTPDALPPSHWLICPLDSRMESRRLSEEHSSLSGASLGKIISTGLFLGIVHVLTGPDHLSALAAMTTGSSWRAFALGIRWGCGHSIGLIVMALIFFAAGQTVDLDAVGGYLNYVVGFFMIALGIWTGVHVREKYQTQLKEGVQSLESGEGREGSRSSTSATPTNLVELRPISQRRLSSVASPAAGPQISMSPGPSNEPVNGDVGASPTSSFHLLLKSDAGSEQAPAKSSRMHPKNWTCCQNMNFENPATQKLMALLVGIIHGFAGPGGILGVLPAVVLNDWLKSVAYLGSFCIASIFIMGVFAALYGEVTGRLGGNSLVMEFRIGIFSAFFSFIVGVAWIGLQATGQMDDILGE